MNKMSALSLGLLAALTLTSVAPISSFAQNDSKSQENGTTQQDSMPRSQMGRGPMMGPGHMMGRGNGMGPQGRMGPGSMMGGYNGMMPMMGHGRMMGMMGNHHGIGHGKWLIEREYTSEDAQRIVDGLLARRGFAKLKVSKVEKAEDGYLKVEVSTAKGEAVFNLKFDIKSGRTAIIQ